MGSYSLNAGNFANLGARHWDRYQTPLVGFHSRSFPYMESLPLIEDVLWDGKYVFIALFPSLLKTPF